MLNLYLSINSLDGNMRLAISKQIISGTKINKDPNVNQDVNMLSQFDINIVLKSIVASLSQS